MASFTAKEVAAHNTRGDCWTIIKGQVYDVTKYMEDHPGGADVLIESAGKDSTIEFDSAGHSEDAFEIMEEYRIGEYKGAPVRNAPKAVTLKKAAPVAAAGSSIATTALTATAAISVAAAALHQAYRLNPEILASLPKIKPGSGSGPGFLEGFIIASALFTVAGTVGVKKLSKHLHFEEGGFMSYAPHKKMPKVTKLNPLLQRGWLDPVAYHALPLTVKEEIAPNVFRLVFALPTPTTVLGLPTGQHLAIKAEIDGKSVNRSYTPISNNSDLGKLELVIKCYPDGLLTGRYLANLEIGDEVQFRGPKGSMRYQRGLCKRIGMLAGGTGITPMFQIIRAICEDDRDLTQISLNFRLYYLVEKAPENWAYGTGYATQELMEEKFPAPGPDSKIMLCGPPDMADTKKTQAVDGLRGQPYDGFNSDERPVADNGSTIDAQNFAFTEDRKIGVTGAVFLILNKMIGTGIFSTPSSIFAATGSVGICLMLWIIGGFLTFCGLSVFLEFGLAIPRSGGEKNYLERVYRHPKYLATCVLASQMILLGFSSGNSLAFGRYILYASGKETPDGWEARGIAVACVTFSVLLHSTLPKWGIRLFNVLGVFKVVILLFIVFSGFAALAGHRRVPDPHNFDNAFRIEDGDGYGGGGAYAYSNALLNIIYSYKGWENANYVLGELKNPRKTLSVAAPIAIGGVTILYVLANVAYFAAIPKSDLAKSEVIVAGLFFRNVFGQGAAARSLPAFVALSNLGNVLAVSFAHARVNQELAKEGMLPFSRFWASNKPFNSPAPSLFLHWLVTVIVLLAPPAGPAYNFIVNLYTYPGSWINGFVTAGLIYLHWSKSENWTSPWHTYLPISVIYLLANIFLALVPFIPPDGDWNADGYPYYVFPVVGVGVLILGGVYWAFWTKILPRIGGYKVVADRTFDDAGVETVRYRKVSVRHH
ncbi:hypothetical protein HYE67_009975 [Fusarium culmorum]|uniref:High-affinity methionine permease n=1 Tax=Fusarium culmorum TaxID=5516 RepID=A0A2T4H8I2_FUSCU|nr:High-affinity methionine permease [Fusarium culmorum]QPC67744.1 hypothetical protein HYE67_009975 [Fusarium culmorum]